MIIYVDIDNTICKTEGCDYESAVPYLDRIARANSWYDAGHKVIYWTARGTGSGINWMSLTLSQLEQWGCNYTQLKLGKPVYDVFIEDKSAFFEPLSIPKELSLPIRTLQHGDNKRGFLSLLAQLTEVGEVSDDMFLNQFYRIKHNPDHHVVVIESDEGKIVGTATLLIEHKFIHGCSSVGHIEDVVVDSNSRGKGYGKMLINHLVSISNDKGCYKVILDCSAEHVGFYNKCNFEITATQMLRVRDLSVKRHAVP